MIQIQDTQISDCKSIQYHPFTDNRGVFCEIFKQSDFPWFKPAQSNYSFSKFGTLRGLHRTPYGKLVTCVSGCVFDVCVDLRPDSPTYNQYFSIELSDQNNKGLYIPPYCGHGFLALADSVVVYWQEQEYNSSIDETYCYSNYDIVWPSPPLIISDKDRGVCRTK